MAWLAPIVEAYGFRKAAFEAQVLEATNNIVTSEREANVHRQALSREVVDDVHRAERSTISEAIVHEVDRPAFVGSGYRRDRFASNVLHFAFLSGSYLEAIRSIDSQESVKSNIQAFAP